MASYFETLSKPGAKAASRSRRNAPPQSPEEEESVLKQAFNTGLSGAAKVGNFLDLPGSMVRDALTWLPGGPAPENPFDQLLSPLSSENRTYSEDLLEGYGLADDDDSWGKTIAGFVGDVALDPLTYVSLGGSAVGKAGKIAKNAGLLDEAANVASRKAGIPAGFIGNRSARTSTTLDDFIKYGPEGSEDLLRRTAEATGENIDDMLDETLGGYVGIGLPFREPSKIMGTGKVGKYFAQAHDDIGRSLMNAKIPGTDLAPIGEAHRLFNAALKEADDPRGMALAKSLFKDQEAARAKARGVIATLAKRTKEMGMANPEDADTLRKLFELPEFRAQASPELQSFADEVEGHLGRILEEQQSLGMGVEELMDPVVEAGTGKYFPRQLNAKFVNLSERGKAPSFSAFDPSKIERSSFLKGIEGMTDTINRLGRNDEIGQLINSGADTKVIKEKIVEVFGDAIPEENLNGLVGFIRDIPEEIRQEGIFGNHPIVDLSYRLMNAEDSIASAKKIHEGLLQPGILTQAKYADPEKHVRLGRVLEDTGFKVGEAKEILREKLGWSKAAMERAVVDKSFAKDLMRFRKAMTSPEPAAKIMDVVDSFTNFWKGSLTTPFPAFHIRNLISGQFNNVIDGTFSFDSTKAAHEMMTGGVVDGAKDIPALKQMAADRGINQLDDAAATSLLGELAYAHSIVGKFEGDYAAMVGSTQAKQGLDEILGELMGPGEKHMDASRTAKRLIGQTDDSTWNPVKAEWRGVAGAKESTFGPMMAGQDMGHYIEGLNRLAPFVQQLKKGVAPAVAAEKVGSAQVQYANRFYTKFQTGAVNRAFPFAKFTQGMIPWTLRQMMEKPGGTLAQTIRGMNAAQDPNAATPDYISETAAIPINDGPLAAIFGSPEGENDRYLTGFGLAAENPLAFLGGDGVRGTLQEIGAMSNPLLKGPAEWAFGRSLFQKGPRGGRDIDDQDPLLGRLYENVKATVTGEEGPRKADPVVSPLFEQVVANSPLSRVLSTARTAFDPRKSLRAKAANLGTGFRVSDVSPASQEAILRDRIENFAKERGAPSFEVTRFRQDDIELAQQTNPELARQMAAVNAILNRLRENAKARAEER